MFYYLYEIKNLVNGKIYIGVHSTPELEDGYMGSGTVIRRAIRKYGVENFQKTILEFFSTKEKMYEREKEIITDEFLLREDVYNVRRGGNGGFGKYHVDRAVETHKKKFSERQIKYNECPAKCLCCLESLLYSKRNNQFCSKSCAATYNNSTRGPASPSQKEKTRNALLGRPKTEEHKAAISLGRRKQLDRLSTSELK